jgi:hypothetical protein
VAVIALLFVGVIFFLAMAGAAIVAARTVSQVTSRNGLARSAEDSELNVRLTRIEEAIDAMANQIERLTEQQRALLTRASDASDG